MKTFTKRVDVLAVIEEERRMRVRNANRERARGNGPEGAIFEERATALREASAAVAELIKALREIEKVCHGQTRGIVVHIDKISHAALAHIGGAS